MAASLCTKNPATRAQVEAIPTPAATESYQPVSYKDFLELLEDVFNQHGMFIDSERYGLSNEGNQLFGVWTLMDEDGNPIMASDGKTQMAVGFRTSHDKTLPCGIVTGGNVFVCDNMMFNGADDQVVRKHTKNVLRDLQAKIEMAASNARPSFARITAEVEALRNVELTDRDFYYFLADLLRTDAINRNLFGKAASLWAKPPHDEFKGRDLYCAYNAVNEALKVSQARDMAGRHFGLHSMALKWAEENTPVATV